MFLSPVSCNSPSEERTTSVKPFIQAKTIPWTENEKQLLKYKWEEFKGDWNFPKDRSTNALQKCFNKFTNKAVSNTGATSTSSSKTIKSKPHRKLSRWSKWTSQEEELLKKAIQKYIGNPNEYVRSAWSSFQGVIPGRSWRQCQYHYENYLDPSIYKGDWTPEEDEIIRTMMKEPQMTSNQIAEVIKEKTGLKRPSKKIYTRLMAFKGKNSRKRGRAAKVLDSKEQNNGSSKKIKTEKECLSSPIPDPSLSTPNSSTPASPVFSFTPQTGDSPVSLDLYVHEPTEEGDNFSALEEIQLINQLFQETLSSLQSENTAPLSGSPLEDHDWLGESNFGIPFHLPFDLQLAEVSEDFLHLQED